MTTLEDWPEERRLDSWPQVADAFLQGELSGWIFRGQPSVDFPLTTRLERDLTGIARSWWPDMENSLLVHFQDRARAHLLTVPTASDLLGWWSLMQHYGAPTRLLDWTASPFIALYFAVAERQANDVALWCLNAAVLRNAHGWIAPFGVDHLGTKRVQTYDHGEVVEDGYPYAGINWHESENDRLRDLIRTESALPYPVIPSRLDPRMLAQQTVFTCDGAMSGGIPFPLYLHEFKDPAGGTVIYPRLLRKIRVPASARRDCLVGLQAMGITADSLFPGLDGIGRATSLRATADLPATVRDVLEGRGPWDHDSPTP